MNGGRGDGSPQAIFFDRDGTLIEHVPYLRDPAHVVLLPGVRDALQRIQAASIQMFLFTNQSGVGRGLFTMADMEAVNRRMIELLNLGPEPFAGICVAPDTPDEPSRYRKPSPRYIHEMLARHDIPVEAAWMVGDSPVDWEAGLAAGVQNIVIVADPSSANVPERRVQLGIKAYSSIRAWTEVALA
jgi:D-glycero-D-manno-heptose 1,7-bisphosphate phosphatase